MANFLLALQLVNGLIVR